MRLILLLLLAGCVVESVQIEPVDNNLSESMINISIIEDEVQESHINLSRIVPNSSVFDGWLMVQDSGKDIEGWNDEDRMTAEERGFISGHKRAYQTGGPTTGQVVQFSLSEYSVQGALEAVENAAVDSEGTFVVNGHEVLRERNPIEIGEIGVFYSETEIIEDLGVVQRHFLMFASKGVYVKIICGGINTTLSFSNCQEYGKMLESNLAQ